MTGRPALIETTDGARGVGENFEAADVVGVALFFDDGAVAIEEDGGAERVLCGGGGAGFLFLVGSAADFLGTRHQGNLAGPFVHGVFDVGNLDASHAAMVDGAFAEEAWTARRRLADDGLAFGDGRGAVGIGGAKDGHDGESSGGGDVHGAGVVADENVASGEVGGEVLRRRLADEIDGAGLHARLNSGGHFPLRMRAKNYHIGVESTN